MASLIGLPQLPLPTTGAENIKRSALNGTPDPTLPLLESDRSKPCFSAVGWVDKPSDGGNDVTNAGFINPAYKFSRALRQDARLCATRLDGAQEVTHILGAGRRAYVQMARGSVPLAAGDGARVENETKLRLHAGANAEVLLFDLP